MITLQNKNEVVSLKSSPKGRKSSQKVAQNPAIVYFLSKHIDVGTQNDRLDEKTQNMITLQNTNEVVSRKSSQKGRVLLTLDHSVRPPLSFRGRTPSFIYLVFIVVERSSTISTLGQFRHIRGWKSV